MRQLAILPENLINKIAAGEVVERPASVVKELVENSIDAGADHIHVEIEKGGMKLIKVSDNGSGIEKSLLPIALKRHATSKLGSLEELESIASLGFRGEALPSIASVSLFEITSKTEQQVSGYKIRLEGGKVVAESDSGAPDGTLIEVRELFFNTPARRKFMKTQVTETRHVIDTINGLALAYPAIGFELVSEGRELFSYSRASDYSQRVRDVLGMSDFKNMVEFSEEAEGLRLFGFTVKPEYARKNRAMVYFIVNGRRIQSSLMYSALRNGYGEFLIKGRYPQAVIYIYMDPSALDVNVSPTKSEVRFSNERMIYGSLMNSVRKALSRDDIIPRGEEGQEIHGRFPQTSARSADANYREKIRDAAEQFFAAQASRDDQSQTSLEIRPAIKTATLEEINPLEIRRQPETEVRVEQRPVPEKRVLGSSPYKVEQFADMFIVAFSRDQVMIIDQHAAHERILYERALKSFQEQKLTSQKLLLPINIEMEPSMIAAAEQYFDLLDSLGFELERFGPRALAVYGIPAVTGGKNPEGLIKDLLSDLIEYGSESEDRFKLAAQMFACRAAIKAGDRLGEDMMRGLVRELYNAENPYICPHGRPTIIRHTVESLRQKFGRS